MSGNVNPTPPSLPGYHAQYKVSPQMKAFWEKLFHMELSDDDVQKLTDSFTKNVCDQMNKVSNHYIENMKKLEAERKEASGG